jgi:thioredoxin reductase (NADPH)
MSENVYDVIIVGGGPAGFAAALYATRDRYSTAVLEKSGLPGGQILLTERVENYPGFKLITGPDLVAKMQKQAEGFGTKTLINHEVTGLVRRPDKLLELDINAGEKKVVARAVILAPGSDYKRLGVPGEEQMRQATKVSYCATCDGAFYKDKSVLAVGGGNTAVGDAIYLAERFTRRLTLVHRRTEFRAQKVMLEELAAKAAKHHIDIKTPYVLEEIVPDGTGEEIDHVRLKNVATGAAEDMKVDGVFVFVGMLPNTQWLRGTVNLTAEGYIRCNCLTLQTSLPGVYVAGDCRAGAAMQLATATADGVIAAMMLRQYFRAPDAWDFERANHLGGSGW